MNSTVNWRQRGKPLRLGCDMSGAFGWALSAEGSEFANRRTFAPLHS
jgi:hypothetical protein